MSKAQNTRDWRDGLPKWRLDAIEAEIKVFALNGALCWPRESEPRPVSFFWGDYDRLYGVPEEGVYWRFSWTPHSWGGATITKVELKQTDKPVGGKHWFFNGSPNVVRGPLYRSSREAALALRWQQCREFAKSLLETDVFIGSSEP